MNFKIVSHAEDASRKVYLGILPEEVTIGILEKGINSIESI